MKNQNDKAQAAQAATRTPRQATRLHELKLSFALQHLKEARDFAKYANCPGLLKKIRSAIASAGGAQRHMSRRMRATAESQTPNR
jgi:hypothetical protein